MPATIEEDLYTFLTGVPAAAGVPVEKGKVGATQGGTRVYFQRDDGSTDVLLSGAPGMTEDLFSVEVGSLTQATTRAIVEGLKAALNGYPANGYTTSSFPNNVVLGVFVSDHADDYEYKGFKADEGFYLAALQVQILR